MLNWQAIWSKRFHAWVWLLLPVLVFMVLMRLSIALGLQSVPDAAELSVRLGISLICLGLGVLGMYRIGRAYEQLSYVARNLVNGRLESRASTHWWGVTGELARHLNGVAKMLAQHRDHQDQMVMQTTTRLRLDQERLQELNAELRHALKNSQQVALAQSELFSNLSHELRTPLTAVLGYADLLRKSGLRSEQQQHLDTLDRSARGMLGMINDLLDWSRIEAGRLKLNEEGFDVLDAVEDTAALLAPLAYEKNLELVRILYHDVPRKVKGDAQRLRQILTNLLSNAIKFTDKGEVVVRVMREREEQGRIWLRFSISDTGIGIALDAQLRLFQPFQQAGRAQGGSGLGLSITRKLTELMGGKVELESAPGRGSSFSALLPLTSLDSSQPLRLPDARLRERAVWLYEPHATARLALLHWLEFWGLRVRVFEALDVLGIALAHASENTKPAVALLGFSQPLASVPASLDFLRTQTARAPLLVMVASASLELHAALRAAGAAGCLPKSASPNALQAELVRLVTSRGAAQLPARGALADRRILVADNNTVNRRYIAALCRELGMDLREAADGLAALDAWQHWRPEFVLLDARMPGLSGPACARELRQLELGGGRRSRVLAISAHLEPDERADFLRAGADGILLKPFDGAQLKLALLPDTGEGPPAVAAMLTADPELLNLLQEELPQQYDELLAAARRKDALSARHAAHQLHGTASFYHLSALKESCAALEKRLAQSAPLEQLETELHRVRVQLDITLRDIRSRLPRIP